MNQYPLSADDFRQAMRLLTLPVAVITVDSGGQRNGLTASSFCSVSVDPPRILVCIGKHASAHSQLVAGEGIGINVLAPHQMDQAMLFASKTRHGEQRFSNEGWHTLKSGAPILKDTAVSFDCIVDQIIDDTTHSIVTATVVAVEKGAGECLLYRNGAPVAVPAEA
ncbi:flavin reductase family protein [Shimwellia blattae]|uniref:Putative flavoprotein oxidoreductase n=1 Tax=Shimwellia blattae (strain ATCC 29907 / DSM 4481 / JCM 1650 / NBRC 105725 / CDC 9005-74) TaxID=630626 RepID=I2BBG3_SHIBC|nr:flavin reductase family protein [Shimwellia blattae]AFJ47867.1 putative flavoprotein oxidoreductase [Shimwellia blattae DSM 4481 = NBRC 105725]GAB79562.1 putative flavin reductase [Shimwellia blattae DSM 4481 = NBRC 105725]VDY65366.1 FMN reductase (NADH) RutF [Shimwellia blattae]VEC24359.1 FMN reductase (NADH) RutF [Shimwellia blattae]